MTNEHDPLRDDGRLYAEKMQVHGTTATHIDYPGLIHGVLNLQGIVDASLKMHDDIGDWVNPTI